MQKTYLVYNKDNRDEHIFLTARDDSECYDAIVAYLDMSKSYIYYSVPYLLSVHKAICDVLDQEYEFIYNEDIENNERAFQEILLQMDANPTIKPKTDKE